MGRFTLPDRWDQYESVGQQIPGTRFITFKVPLKREFSEINSLGPKERFTPDHLQELLQERGLNLGLVIDLTFTDRYYHPKEFQRNKIEHMKIKTQGKSVPNRAVCKRFLTTVDKFLEENKENDHLIGVHCTHGVNRTGYLVCRYMIDKLDFIPDKAIEACGRARGYTIERENYLDSLKEGKTTYEDVQDDCDMQEKTQHRQRGNFNDRRGHFNDHFQGHPNEQSQSGNYGKSRGYANNFNSYNSRGRGGYGSFHERGYGNGYQRPPASAPNDFAPKRFGHQHGYDNGYNSQKYGAHQQDIAPRTFGHQHGASGSNYGSSRMPPTNNYARPQGSYNGRQQPYKRQNSWQQERSDFSRQNSYSDSRREERRPASHSSQRSNRGRNVNPYSQYS